MSVNGGSRDRLLAGFSTSAEDDEKLLATLEGKMRVAVSFRLEKKRSDSGVLRDQICTTQGPKVNCARQVDF